MSHSKVARLVAPIELCPMCTERRPEALIVGHTPPLYLCFNCLSERSEFQFFKGLVGARKMPQDLVLRRTEVARALREQGLTYDAIAARFSVTHVPVRRWLIPDEAKRGLQDTREWYARNGESKRERRRAHEQAHPLYTTWVSMRHRCYAPSSENYADYGGRGIKMHPTWENNFDAFEAWLNTNLGPRPEGTTLDRIDNDGDYEPGNVRWATRLVQQGNRRSHVKNSVVNKLRAQLRDAGLEPCA